MILCLIFTELYSLPMILSYSYLFLGANRDKEKNGIKLQFSLHIYVCQGHIRHINSFNLSVTGKINTIPMSVIKEETEA